jgi:hypothetical protein
MQEATAFPWTSGRGRTLTLFLLPNRHETVRYSDKGPPCNHSRHSARGPEALRLEDPGPSPAGRFLRAAWCLKGWSLDAARDMGAATGGGWRTTDSACGVTIT